MNVLDKLHFTAPQTSTSGKCDVVEHDSTNGQKSAKFSPATNSIGFWDMLITRKGTTRCWSGLTTTRAKLNPCLAH